MEHKNALTGRWRVNTNLHKNQKELMVALGRSSMEQWAIQFADEDLLLFQFQGLSKTKDPIYKFQKQVHIYLRDLKYRNLAKTIYGWVGKDPDVKYDFCWTASLSTDKRKKYHHEDDQKNFGTCESECYLGSKYATNKSTRSFTVVWKLQRDKSILKNSHHINEQGQLVCHLDYTFKKYDFLETVSAVKIYDRVPFTPEDEKEMEHHKMSKQLLKPV